MSEEKAAADGELVRRARQGDTVALAELVNRWAGRVLALCHSQVSHAETAADLAQETLLRGLRDLNSLTQPEKFGPWLRGIAKRVCWDWLKAKKRQAALLSTLDGEPELTRRLASCGGAMNGDQVEWTDELQAAIAGLPEECREVLMIYYYQELTYQEIAELLEVSAATVNARLTRARSLLRRQLAPVQESRA